MSDQRTFRDVAKPKRDVAPTINANVLALNGSTVFNFAPSSEVSITGFSDYAYLIDGQEIAFINSGSANVVFSSGGFVKTLAPGYSFETRWDEANSTFFQGKTPLHSKVLEEGIATNVSNLSQEILDRTNEDLTFLKLDGTRAMTAALNVGGFSLDNVLVAASALQAVNKGQMDTQIALLQAQISANSSSLSWRSPVVVVTERISADIPVNGEALADISLELFEDDDQTVPYTTSNFPVDTVVLFTKTGVAPKLMISRDDAGTKKWFDETEATEALKLERQAEAGDTFIVTIDLLDDADKENSSIYHIVNGSPAQAIKIGDIDWSTATGIKISTGYAPGAGGETVIVGDTVQAAIQKIDGNIAKELVDRATADALIVSNLASIASGFGASLVGIEDLAGNYVSTTVEEALAENLVITNNAITASQTAQNLALASVATGNGAALIGIEDSAAIYVATTVEGALAEVKVIANDNAADIVNIKTDITTLNTAVGNNSTAIGTNATNLANLESALVSVANNEGASKIGVEDVAGNFTGDDVESALVEISDRITNLNLVEQSRGLFETTVSGTNDLDLSSTGDFLDDLGGSGSIQDLSGATYMNAVVVRDGAIAIGGVGYTVAGGILTFTAASGGTLVKNEVVEVRLTEIS